MKELISRIKSIHNSTNNIGWGSCEYSPMMQTGMLDSTESQCVVVVGHNVHRSIYTLFIEKFTNGVFRVSTLTKDSQVDEVISIDNDRSVIINEIIVRLKQWFPEIRR